MTQGDMLKGNVTNDMIFTAMPIEEQMMYLPKLSGPQAKCLYNRLNGAK